MILLCYMRTRAFRPPDARCLSCGLRAVQYMVESAGTCSCTMQVHVLFIWMFIGLHGIIQKLSAVILFRFWSNIR